MQIEKNNYRFHIPSADEAIQNINIQTRNSQSVTVDVKLKKFEKNLEEWKDLLLFLDSVFQGEKPIIFSMLVALNALFYFYIWYYDPNFLQIATILISILLLIDIVAVQFSSFWSSNAIGDDQNKRYEFICSLIYFYLLKTGIAARQILHFRLNKPLMFYATAIPTIFLAYWLSTKVCVIFLAFLLSNLILFTALLRVQCCVGLIATFLAAIFFKLQYFTNMQRSCLKTD